MQRRPTDANRSRNPSVNPSTATLDAVGSSNPSAQTETPSPLPRSTPAGYSAISRFPHRQNRACRSMQLCELWVVSRCEEQLNESSLETQAPSAKSPPSLPLWNDVSHCPRPHRRKVQKKSATARVTVQIQKTAPRLPSPPARSKAAHPQEKGGAPEHRSHALSAHALHHAMDRTQSVR